MTQERRHHIGRERIKYKNQDDEPDRDRIRVTCKAIERECTNVTVRFEIMQNGTTTFIVRGTEQRNELALRLIHHRLKGMPKPDPPESLFQLTVENVRMHNRNITERRQFACRPCGFIWWRKVFAYKPASRCSKCHIRYDPISKLQEYGWGHFRCDQCGNEFTGRARAGVEAPCFRCRNLCLPDRIGPMPPDHGDRPPATGNRHACQACDHGRIRPCPTFTNIPFASVEHDSTGSTVSTFLTQQTESSFSDYDV